MIFNNFIRFLDIGASKVGTEITAPWFWYSSYSNWFKDFQIILNYEIQTFNSIFGFWSLESKSWDLSTMIFGFPIVDLTLCYSHIFNLLLKMIQKYSKILFCVHWCTCLQNFWWTKNIYNLKLSMLYLIGYNIASLYFLLNNVTRNLKVFTLWNLNSFSYFVWQAKLRCFLLNNLRIFLRIVLI